MARKPPPDMGQNLGGFDALFPAARAVDDPPATIPDPSVKAPGTGLEATERRPRRSKAPIVPQGDQAPAKTDVPPKSKWGEGRSRNTRSFSITDEIYERIRRCAFHEGTNMSDLAERVFTSALDRLEERRGSPYPPVPQAKKGSALDEL